MLKILSVVHKLIPKDSVKIYIKLQLGGRKHIIFFQYPQKYFDETKLKNIDYIVPFLYLVAYKQGLPIDFGGYYISKDLLDNLDKVKLLYSQWFPDNYTSIQIDNYKISKNISKNNDSVGLVFSGGVDSLYTMYHIHTDIDCLLTVFGFDIHHKDQELILQVKQKFDDFAKKNNKNMIYMYTNLRCFTEQYISWNYIFGAGLGSVGLLLDAVLHKLYISSWIDSDVYPWGSHPELDKLWSNNNIECVHYGKKASRIEKIRYLDGYPDSYHILRVCWENLGNMYNCSKCEKCMRTILEYTIVGTSKKLITLNNDVNESSIFKLFINKANYSYYKTIQMFLLESKNIKLRKYAELIQERMQSFNKYIPKKRMKKKNIIFMDFNGVISYKRFRDSFQRDNNNLFNDIQKFLFAENIDLVKGWMKGQYTSEEICGIIAKNLGENETYLYDTLVADSKDLDVSEPIILKLKKLKKYYKIVLVTDNMDCFSRWIVPSHKKLFAVFDDIFDSNQVGFFKKENDGKVFLDYIEKYGAQIENSILIDDSENNCNAFVGLGGLAYQTTGEDGVIQQLSLISKKIRSKRLWQF